MVIDNCIHPLEEGKPIRKRIMKLVDGKWVFADKAPEDVPEWQKQEVIETETYIERGNEEFYDHVIMCKACETEFIAYNKSNEAAKNYCPGCGKKLV